MNVGIIGAGAMGCIYGMYLSRKHSVLLVDVVQAHVDAINENGLEFTHLDGTTETVTRLRATTDTSSCTPADLVILLTKGYQSAQALEANSTLIGPDTIVCSLQNGYGNADDIEKYVPTEQIVLGTSGGGATVAGPGRILHKGQGPTQLGCLTEDQSRAELVARVMSECGVPQVENPGQFSIQGFCPFIAPAHRVDRSVDFFRDCQFGNPIGTRILDDDISVFVEAEVSLRRTIRPFLPFRVRIGIAEIQLRDQIVSIVLVILPLPRRFIKFFIDTIDAIFFDFKICHKHNLRFFLDALFCASSLTPTCGVTIANIQQQFL